MKKTVVFALLLSACAPSSPIPVTPPGEGATHSAPMPIKPPPAPVVLPPNVIRTVLPDGSISVTIREPVCPPCQPWGF